MVRATPFPLYVVWLEYTKVIGMGFSLFISVILHIS